MERRKFLLGAGSTAIGASALVGSGAFSFVAAERDMSIDIVGDEDAFLGLEATSEYADGTSNGQLSINFDENAGVDGEGLNQNALSEFPNVFRITNQGSRLVRLMVRADEYLGPDLPEEISLPIEAEGTLTNGRLGGMEDLNWSGRGGTSTNDAPHLGPGEAINVSFRFELNDLSDPQTVYDDIEAIDALGITADEV